MNLKRIALKVVSPLIFAHVRAAYPGMLVTEANCHPFHHGRFLWMHNGMIGEYRKMSRKARDSLRDDLYDFMQGTTDSEMTFALFLNQIKDPMGDYTPEELKYKVVATLKKIDQLSKESGVTSHSLLNFAVTDGRTVVATRYVSKEGVEPATLYFSSGTIRYYSEAYCVGTRFECDSNAQYRMIQADKRNKVAIITSEPLTDEKDWVVSPIVFFTI
jgi:glutamine amidotransferase